RDRNQDAYFISSSETHPLFIIADGMGGHKAGEVASNMAIEIVSNQLVEVLQKLTSDEEEIRNEIRSSIDIANEKIYKRSLIDERLSGMGTTITIAYINRWKVYIGHVGDSRAYILRKRTLHQLTRDHSLVEELIRNGSISEEEAKNHPQRNIITRAVGTNDDVEVDLIVGEIYEDDILLLCSDGLSNMLSDDEIEKILLNSSSMGEACENLVELSKDKGGFDNITVLAVKF
ncbi:MAG TPA: Stp1/IreP family PP2C-type Ser/Thr phosphatase, partial [Tepidimicrobium sp.]|nr:Stp1/IreP family PP2C-type Ser/Thr phosphatase [Tepidimicrobium sp.]